MVDPSAAGREFSMSYRTLNPQFSEFHMGSVVESGEIRDFENAAGFKSHAFGV
jgi:hypothetical protein